MKTLLISLIASLTINMTFAQTKGLSKFIGIWSFEAKAAPYEFKNGKVDISSINDKLKVLISPAYGGALETQIIKSGDDIISVSFEEDGETVYVDIKEKEGEFFATATSRSIGELNAVLAKDDIGKFLGKWKFDAKGAPYGYQSGTIELAQVDAKLTSKIVFPGKNIEIKTIKYNNGVVSFSFEDDEAISVTIKERDGYVGATAASSSMGLIDVELSRQ